MSGPDGYWTFSEWVDGTVHKIATGDAVVSEEHRADYLKVQIRSAIMQALRHGRSGRGDDDPVEP